MFLISPICQLDRGKEVPSGDRVGIIDENGACVVRGQQTDLGTNSVVRWFASQITKALTDCSLLASNLAVPSKCRFGEHAFTGFAG